MATWINWVAVATAAVLAGYALLVAFGAWRWKPTTRALIERLEVARRPMPPSRFDAARDLDGLPPPVQRFFRAALADGTRHVAALSMQHRGSFNLAAEGPDRWIRAPAVPGAGARQQRAGRRGGAHRGAEHSDTGGVLDITGTRANTRVGQRPCAGRHRSRRSPCPAGPASRLPERQRRQRARAGQQWLAEVANVRIHGATHRVPQEVFAQEDQPVLNPVNPRPYDVARPASVRASRQFRVVLETNKYSVPAQHAGRLVTLKAYPDRVCIYWREQLVARHLRSYDRHQDIEDPEHPRALLAQRKSAREQRLMQRFLALSPQAAAYHEGLQARRTNARDHVRRIVALAEIHGERAVERALVDGLAFQAFSAEYVANMLEMRLRELPEPAALQMTRRSDLLDMELPEPDLSRYDKADDDDEDGADEV